jgi:DNA-binding LytR/AlgR family response regulator
LTLQKEGAEYEQKALHLQMNPHFFFDCLGSISSFIVQNGTDSALKYLSKLSKVIRLPFEVSDIIRCDAKGNYIEFFIKNDKPLLLSKTLKEYEELLTEHGFERIHQSHLINLSFLKSYIKSD